jgi:hypothetical protein
VDNYGFRKSKYYIHLTSLEQLKGGTQFLRLSDEFIMYDNQSLFKPFSLTFSSHRGPSYIKVEPNFGLVYLSETAFDPIKSINLLDETFLFEMVVNCLDKSTILVFSIDKSVVHLGDLDDLMFHPIWISNLSDSAFIAENVPIGTFIANNFTVSSQIDQIVLGGIQRMSLFNKRSPKIVYTLEENDFFELESYSGLSLKLKFT